MQTERRFQKKGRESNKNQSCIAKDHCLSSSLSFGVLLAHSSMSWAISLCKFLLLTSLLLKIRSFLIFQRFNMQAAKHIFQTLAWFPCLVSSTWRKNCRIERACDACWAKFHLSQAQAENLQCKVIWSIDSTAGHRSQPASWHHSCFPWRVYNLCR
jgi:hypothetical protein